MFPLFWILLVILMVMLLMVILLAVIVPKPGPSFMFYFPRALIFVALSGSLHK
jgi:hypothetical protein